MKLIFTKEGEDIKIEIGAGTVTEEFDYVKMVQSLIDNNEIEEPDFGEGISDEEQATIKTMLLKIQEAIASDEVEEDSEIVLEDNDLSSNDEEEDIDEDDLPF